jgi:hypothetical protein
MGVQTHYKKRFTKEIASKNVSKEIDKITQNRCLLDFFYHLFLGEGSLKTRLKISPKK